MKKLTALLLATSLSLTLFGCKDKGSNKGIDNGAQQTNEDDGLVSVWLLTSETGYSADGTRVTACATYTYTDKGMPLTEVYGYDRYKWDYDYDTGDRVEVYQQPYDGQISRRVEYTYTDRGDLHSFTEIVPTYDEDGKKTGYTSWGTKDQYDFYYDDKGRIERVDSHGRMNEDSVTEELVVSRYFCYDDNGRLFEIYSKNWYTGYTQWDYEYRYDDNGRLVTSARYVKEGLFSHAYTYNDSGQLAGVTVFYSPQYSQLDDQQFDVDYGFKSSEAPAERGSADFTYDSNGYLTERTGTVPAKCTYDDAGKLKTVTYSDGDKYVYVDSETAVGTDATYLVRDKNGNVVKLVRPDGSYMVFAYQRFDLTQEEAAQCNAVRLANSRSTPIGENYYWINFTGSLGEIPDLPIPETALHFTDEVRARDYRNR